jgi:general secretion pathway protein G
MVNDAAKHCIGSCKLKAFLRIHLCRQLSCYAMNAKEFTAKGFTLVELLVVLAILAMLLTLAVPRYFTSLERAKEAALQQSLNAVRENIDKFYADKGRYPESLEDLVAQKYIRKLPMDPIMGKDDTWVLISPEPPLVGNVYDIRSGSTAIAKDGSRYADW